MNTQSPQLSATGRQNALTTQLRRILAAPVAERHRAALVRVAIQPLALRRWRGVGAGIE